MVRFHILAGTLIVASNADNYCCYDGCSHVASDSCEKPDSWCGSAESNCKQCSGDWCPGSITPTPPAPPPPPTPPAPPPGPPPPPGSRTPMYVALRMDDISIGYVSEQQQQAIHWAQKNNVKFNFGIITGSPPWPTTCAESPTGKYCDDLAVKAMYDAYASGNVSGTTGGSGIIEIFDHSWDHEGWPEKFNGLSEAEFKTWMEDDMQKSTTQLRQAFPEASITAFVAPQNLANKDVLTSMKANGLNTLSTQGTLGCHLAEGSPPHYNYFYGPCEHDGQLDCVPEGDVYVTSEGWRPVDGIFSTPIGCASSSFISEQIGITADQAWGEGKCGCIDNICSVFSSAEQYAEKSNGLHWAVVMMHPQTAFPNGQRTDAWLDDFVRIARASPTYEVHFVHFQDLVKLTSPSADDAIAV